MEKADILELTVDHLRSLRARRHLQRAYGYSACAQEVDSFLVNARYDQRVRQRMMLYLASRQASLVTSAELAEYGNENDPRALQSIQETASEVDARSRSVDQLIIGSNMKRLTAANSSYSCTLQPVSKATLQCSSSMPSIPVLNYISANVLGFESSTPIQNAYNFHGPMDDYTHLSMCSSSSSHDTSSRSISCTPEIITNSLSIKNKYSGIDRSSASAVQSADIDTTSCSASIDDVIMSTNRLECTDVSMRSRSNNSSSNDNNDCKIISISAVQKKNDAFRKQLLSPVLSESSSYKTLDNKSVVKSESESAYSSAQEADSMWRPW